MIAQHSPKEVLDPGAPHGIESGSRLFKQLIGPFSPLQPALHEAHRLNPRMFPNVHVISLHL